MNTFIIEDGYNTSYLDTLYMALFYRATHLGEILINLPSDAQFSYLLELINTNFIEKIRKSHSIDSSIINEIRNYSFFCKWKEGCDVTALYNPIDYFDFLMKGIGFIGIKYELTEVPKKHKKKKDKKDKKDNIVTSISEYYINALVEENTSIKALIKKWINKLTYNSNGNKSHYHFTELPTLIPIYLNRSAKESQLEKFKIDISEKIRFENNNDESQLSTRWIIHSIICKSSNNSYYAVICMPNKHWYLFSNAKTPSLIKIDISEDEIANKVKQECIIVFYRLDDDLMAF